LRPGNAGLWKGVEELKIPLPNLPVPLQPYFTFVVNGGGSLAEGHLCLMKMRFQEQFSDLALA
jgi:hypothetical protein